MKIPVKLILVLLLMAGPLVVFSEQKTATNSTLAAQIEQKLVGVSPNTVIIVVDEKTNTAFLRGSVASQADADRIMDMVRSVNGVRVIGSNLVVAGSSTGTIADNTADNTLTTPTDTTTTDLNRDTDMETTEGTSMPSTTIVTTDASLRAAVEDALKSEGINGQSKIKVNTENGIVTLTGIALSEAHADRIVALARSVPGVVDVQTNIQLRDEKRVYKVKPSSDRDKEGREVDKGESRVDDDDDD
jgi:osmotically-inducible protein OsmY